MKLVDIEGLEISAKREIERITRQLEQCTPEQLLVLQAELRVWRNVMVIMEQAKKV